MKYADLKKKHSDEFSTLPLFFAFNEKQFKEGLNTLDCGLMELVDIGSGGYMRKVDKHLLDEMFARHESEREAALLDDGFLLDALVYQLTNHEFCYTNSPADALEAVGVSFDDARVARILKEAKVIYWANLGDNY
jgi:hypothetical protein